MRVATNKANNKAGINLDTGSEDLCPVRLEWTPQAIARRRGAFVTIPCKNDDGNLDEEVIGIVISKKGVLLMKSDSAAINDTASFLKKQGVQVLPVDTYMSVELNEADEFTRQACDYLINPGALLTPKYWKPSDTLTKALAVSESPFKEHMQGMVTNLQELQQAIKNPIKLAQPTTLTPHLPEIQ